MANHEPAVQVERVSKSIKGQLVLDNVSLEVRRGTIAGLVGRNGSGKTMLIRILCGLVRPSEGRVCVLGQEVGQGDLLPRGIGALIEQPGFLPQYSGIKNLRLLALIRGQVTGVQIAATLRRLGLDPDSRKPVGAYSQGMRQRLGIAQAIMEEPELLILDEPTNGLDTEGVRLFHDLVLGLRDRGVTVLMASHYMEEIGALCDQVFRMELGRLVAASAPGQPTAPDD